MPTKRESSVRASIDVKENSEEFAAAEALAYERLYPSIFASNYLVLSNRRVHMREFFAAHRGVGKVLDVGAQYCPYYPLFKSTCESYTSMDVVATPIVDIVCNAEQMPVDSCSYDLILCTQVLEHCIHPDRIIAECYRVMKPGGTLIVTVPSIYPQHGYPGDYWRFMPDGMRHLLREFSRVEVMGELDFAESFASVACHYGHVLLYKTGPLERILTPLWNLVTNVTGRGFSMLLRPFAKHNFTSFSMNLWAKATKGYEPLDRSRTEATSPSDAS